MATRYTVKPTAAEKIAMNTARAQGADLGRKAHAAGLSGHPWNDPDFVALKTTLGISKVGTAAVEGWVSAWSTREGARVLAELKAELVAG